MKKDFTCFVDMDGVAANFVQGALNAHGFDDFQTNEIIGNWPRGEFSIPKVLGMTSLKFWGFITQEVWENLSVYPETLKLMETLHDFFGFENVFFLSSPTTEPSCLHGKGTWIKDHFPDMWYKRMFVFTPHKYLFANNRAILVDDYEVNCKKFSEAGGWSILYPQPWNRLHMFKGDRIEHVISGTESITWRKYDRGEEAS